MSFNPLRQPRQNFQRMSDSERAFYTNSLLGYLPKSSASYADAAFLITLLKDYGMEIILSVDMMAPENLQEFGNLLRQNQLDRRATAQLPTPACTDIAFENLPESVQRELYGQPLCALQSWLREYVRDHGLPQDT